MFTTVIVYVVLMDYPGDNMQTSHPEDGGHQACQPCLQGGTLLPPPFDPRAVVTVELGFALLEVREQVLDQVKSVVGWLRIVFESGVPRAGGVQVFRDASLSNLLGLEFCCEQRYLVRGKLGMMCQMWV